jgi:hypothetical protein
MHKNAYLRDAWNWIDFLVVVTGLIEILKLPLLSLNSLRTLRVIRPLRSISAIPSMKKLIQGMIDSMQSLVYAILFMGFVFVNFAIFGIQQFGGAYFYRCRTEPGPVGDIWAYDTQIRSLCSNETSGGFQCQEN